MECLDNEKVCSVRKEDNSGYYRLHTIWQADSFLLNITSKNGAWRGEMTAVNVQSMCNHLDVESTTYLNQCREALTTHDGQPGFVYAVENGNFIWKKIIDEDSGVKIKMGSVRLVPTNFVDTIQNLVTVALKSNNKLQKDLIELQNDRQKHITERKALLNKLDDLITAKDVMETDLYSRFTLLLNSKKKKIAELEDILAISRNSTKNNDTDEDQHNMETDNESDKEDQYNVETDNESDKEDQYNVETDNESDKEDQYNVETDNESDKEESGIGKADSLHHKLSTCNIRTEKKKSTTECYVGGKRTKKDQLFEKIQKEANSSNADYENIGKEELVSTTDSIPTTKDELLEYFYGP